MNRRAAGVIVVAMPVMTAGCPADRKSETDYDCIGRECATRTVDTFVPRDAPVHVVVSKSYRVGEAERRITFVRYGVEADRDYSSYLCAIEATTVELLAASWLRPEERPLDVRAACPAIADDTSAFHLRCDACSPPALDDPIFERADVAELVRSECELGGSFRACFACKCGDGTGPVDAASN